MGGKTSTPAVLPESNCCHKSCLTAAPSCESATCENREVTWGAYGSPPPHYVRYHRAPEHYVVGPHAHSSVVSATMTAPAVIYRGLSTPPAVQGILRPSQAAYVDRPLPGVLVYEVPTVNDYGDARYGLEYVDTCAIKPPSGVEPITDSVRQGTVQYLEEKEQDAIADAIMTLAQAPGSHTRSISTRRMG